MSDEKVNLNQATVTELAVLHGIGEKLAAKIVDYRQEQGEFTAVEDLSSVPGISDRMVEALVENLTVGVGSSASEPTTIEDEASQFGDEEQATDIDIIADEDARVAESVLDETGLAEVPSDAVIAVSPEGEAVVTEASAADQLETGPQGESQEPAEDEPLFLEEGDMAVAEGVPDEEGTAMIGESAGDVAAPAEEPAAESVEQPAIETPPEDELEPESIVLLESGATDQQAVEEAAPRPPAPAGKESQSSLIAGYILSALAGAFLGAVLVLFFLLVVNGTLRFAGDSRANDIQQQMDDDISTLNQNQSGLQATAESLTGDLQALDDRLATVTADQATLGASQSFLQEDMSSLGEEVISVTDDLGDISATVTSLEAQAAAMDERLEKAAESAEVFDAFLNGMRDLLLTLQGTAPAAAGTPEPTGSATPDATTVPGASATPAPTRTPRPTATPLTLPSPTPRS